MLREIYLDHTSATPPSARAIQKMLPYHRDLWGHPSSPHAMGQRVIPAIEEALHHIYRLLEANDEGAFVFTSSGTEAIHHLLLSIYSDTHFHAERHEVITTSLEEASILMGIGRLELFGCRGKMIEAISSSKIDPKEVEKAIGPHTALLTMAAAHPLTGVLQPVEEIAAICHQAAIPLHLDITHTLGKVDLNFDKIAPTFLTFNGDQLHAPKGTGGLYIKPGAHLSPLLPGGMEQGGLRGGIYNVGALIALGEAAHEATEGKMLYSTEVTRLRDRLEEGICQGFPAAIPFFAKEDRLPHVTLIGFPGILNEALLFALNEEKLYASIGGGGFQQVSTILQELGVPPVIADSAIHFSLSKESCEEEVEIAIDRIVRTATRMRQISAPVYPTHIV